MSFHGKMEQLRKGQADKEIQLWAYQQIEKEPKELTDEEIDTIVRDFFGEVDSFYDFRLVIRRCIRKAQENG